METDRKLGSAARREMLDTVCSEAERMERLITNLLDMTRLEAGLNVRKEWQPLQEIIGSALHRLKRRLGDRPVRIELAPNLPLIQIDGVLLEQVLINLLDNAIG